MRTLILTVALIAASVVTQAQTSRQFDPYKNFPKRDTVKDSARFERDQYHAHAVKEQAKALNKAIEGRKKMMSNTIKNTSQGIQIFEAYLPYLYDLEYWDGYLQAMRDNKK